MPVDPLPQDEYLVQVDSMFERRMDVAQLAVRCEKHQRPAADCPSNGRDDLFDVSVELLLLGPGKVHRQADEGLVEEVERRRQDELFDVRAETDTRPEIVERPSNRQSRRSEHGRAPFGVYVLTQARTHVDRCGAQNEVLAARDQGEPVDAIGFRGSQRLVDEPRCSV